MYRDGQHQSSHVLRNIRAQTHLHTLRLYLKRKVRKHSNKLLGESTLDLYSAMESFVFYSVVK